MIKKWFAGLFLAFLCAFLAFAQNGKNQNETNWEFLEVSETSGCGFVSGKYCRTYYYLTSGVTLKAQASLEWMKESGWELVGVATRDQNYGLYFKRRYNKTRTDNEIERLKTEFEKEIPKPSENKLLVDLDTFEAKQKLDEFNKAEESKLRTALEQIKILPLKLVSVSANSRAVGQPIAGAELVVDATSVLLKDGNNYRSSDADRYAKEVVKQVLDGIKLSSSTRLISYAREITQGTVKPRVGDFVFYDGINLKISLVVNYQNQQIVVAQVSVKGEWAANPQ